MENKYMKYILIGLACIVWGAIVYRVVHGMTGPDSPIAAAAAPAPPVIPTTVDSFTLYADYPDPFIPEKDSFEAVITHPNGTGTPNGSFNPNPPAAPGFIASGASTTTTAAPPPVQSFLLYTGLITNPTRKLKVAIITLHGTEWLVKEKEKKEDLLIRRIDPDKLLVLYKGRPVTIYRK